MAKQTYFVPVQPYWDASDDVLLTALIGNGGELYAALEAVEGQAVKGEHGPTQINLRYSRVTDDGIEALAGLTEVTQFESSKRMTDASLVHLRAMTKLERLTLLEMRVTGNGLRHLA